MRLTVGFKVGLFFENTIGNTTKMGMSLAVGPRLEHVAGARECGIDAVVYESPRTLIAELAKRNVRFNL